LWSDGDINATLAVNHNFANAGVLMGREPINMIGVMADENDPPKPALHVEVWKPTLPPAVYAPRPEKLLAIIRFLAPHSERVIFSRHARERMEEREITDLDAIRALRLGHIKGEIRPGKKVGEWVCKVAYQIRGARQIGVVTIVIQSQTLWINTVEWEDK
jgi:hypothetical protein